MGGDACIATISHIRYILPLMRPMHPILMALAPLAAPVAAIWVLQSERRAILSGRPLTCDEKIDAFLLGVAHPERVRVLDQCTIGEPGGQLLMPLARKAGFPKAAAITVRYGILIEDFPNPPAQRRGLIAHELAHVAQFERMGLIGMLTAYIRQVCEVGYFEAPLEIEACALAERIVLENQQ